MEIALQQMKEGESLQKHFKILTDLFDSLSTLNAPVSLRKTRLYILLTSLPDSFRMVVTALEASSETVPRTDVVVERLMNEEQKMTEVKNTEDYLKVFTASFHKKGPPKRKVVHCHYYKKPEHFKKDCRKLLAKDESKNSKSKEAAMKAISSGQCSIVIMNFALA